MNFKKYLLIVSILMDDNKGISKNKINPFDFMKLSILSQKNIVQKDAWYLIFFPKEKQETIRILHNKYMLNNSSGIFFRPTANDIVKYKFAFGCTHYARVFISVIKSLGFLDNPKLIRYAISCESSGYNDYLVNKKRKMINGHQFVIVNINNQWYGINTNRKNDFIYFPSNFNPDMDLTKKNYPITFSKIPEKTFLLRKIGKDYNDECGDFSLERLKNIYISGDPENYQPKWKKYHD